MRDLNEERTESLFDALAALVRLQVHKETVGADTAYNKLYSETWKKAKDTYIKYRE
jgi:hypothetical protein